MAYRVHYTLEVKEGDTSLLEEFWNTSDVASYCLDKHGNANESSSAYLGEDLRAFSSKHPEAVFYLTAVGEDGDTHTEYHQNGKYYHEDLKPKYNFDSSKLK